MQMSFPEILEVKMLDVEVLGWCDSQQRDNMEVTALCIKLNAAFPGITPNKLQFFEYDCLAFNCKLDDSSGWNLMRTLKKIIPTNSSNFVTSAGSSTIKFAFSSDSGEYWCENGDGLRSNSVNVTVTAGSVILESPVLPVKEGDDVTLHCKKKKSSADLIADFYKDGVHIKTGYKGNMTIRNVSTSDEGLYKCNISGAGQSPESRLAVRAFLEPDEEMYPPYIHSPNLLTPLWIVVTFSPVALLLLVLGVLHCRKQRGKEDKTEGGGDLVYSEDVTYAVVIKPRKAQETTVPQANFKPSLPEESAVYSSVNFTITESRDTG
uniref:low affinity immunoglobulin gamma Fc region receptor III-A-like n=1 Tax=Semicossyphus pulcher TaxID=241346 RepID=UPI0037E8865E